MKEWLLIITTIWGSPDVGGEAKYVGGPYASLSLCISAAANPRLPRPVVGDGHRIVRVECVLRDLMASF